MSNRDPFNDTPIDAPEDDQYGVDQFALALSEGFRRLRSTHGATIALNGAWGSGKSSAVNLVRHHLKPDVASGDLSIVDFKCWWFKGEEALTLAFLQELEGALEKTFGNKVRDLIGSIGKKLLRAGPVLGGAVNLATVGAGDAAKASFELATQFLSDGDSLESAYRRLHELLEAQKRRFLVIIDDIDRLTPDEALQIFRLVKSVGRLPNVMYLLVFDRELAEKAVLGRYPSEGPHFLEKIVQAGFELPLPDRDQLNNAVLKEVERLCGAPKGNDALKRFMNVFYDAVAPYIVVPRDVVRLSNSMSVTWPAITKEVDIADFVALEAMRLREGALYSRLRANRERVCGASDRGERKKSQEELQFFLEAVDATRRAQARDALMRLFPRFEGIGYGASSEESWEADRRVCSKKHFDTYFRFSIGAAVLPRAEIDEIIERCGDKKFIQERLRGALAKKRVVGGSLIPPLFSELNVHAPRVSNKDIPVLISAIFEIADDLNVETDGDRGIFVFGDNQLRIHWLIRRLTLNRMSLEERSTIFVAACEHAPIGWLVNFVSSAWRDYYPKEGEQPEVTEKCLVTQVDADNLVITSVEKIEASANDGTLILHQDLGSILFRWCEFKGDDGAAVREWTDEQLKYGSSVARLAAALTGESWSQEMGTVTMGDRVAVRRPHAQIDGIKKIINVAEFRRRLEFLERSSTLGEDQAQQIQEFLDAWRKRESGDRGE